MMCFKTGRVTIPPSFALAAGGIGDVTPELWSEISRLRAGKGRTEGGEKSEMSMRALMRGGWKQIPEGERWWDAALASVEAERVRRLEIICKLREGLDGARYL